MIEYYVDIHGESLLEWLMNMGAIDGFDDAIADLKTRLINHDKQVLIRSLARLNVNVVNVPVNVDKNVLSQVH